MTELRNRINKDELKVRLAQEEIERVTFSFYKYVNIENTKELRDQLFIQWTDLNCFGRIYVAHEGINAQMSVPKSNWDNFINQLYNDSRFINVPFKIAVDDDGKSFYKLGVKIRDKVVADGIDDDTFNPSNTGTYLNAEGFKETSLNSKKEVSSLADAIKKVPTAYGTNKGVVTYRTYLPCYTDTTDSTTLMFVVIIRPDDVDSDKVKEVDAKFPSIIV